MGEVMRLDREISFKSIVNHALHVFDKSFINHNNEIILEPRNNVYFRLEGVDSEFEFKCKLLAWLSRPISKGLNSYWSGKLLGNLNELLDVNFSKEDMYMIYEVLGNDVDRDLTISFIEEGYNFDLLRKKI